VLWQCCQLVVVVDNGVLQAGAAGQTFRLVTLGFLAGGGDSYPFPADAAVDVIDLEMEGVQAGAATFVDEGTEQDALAEFLLSKFPADGSGASFNAADTPAATDTVLGSMFD